MNRVARLAAALAAVLSLSACIPPLEQIRPDDSEPWPGGGEQVLGGEPDDSFVYDQQVDWSGCGIGDCATIQVPLDWTNPNGQTIDLAITRVQTADPAKRRGSVVINPGGPGGGGIDFASVFAEFAGNHLLEHYDVVSFDPRGVGQSTPIQCGTAEELNAYFLSDETAETEADIERLRAENEAFAMRCRELTGPLIANVDTASAARDMDVIRALVGDDMLNYVGFSYGTQLGATYAVLYPDRVGSFVLDGAVNFLLPPEDQSRTQAEGFELALGNYVADCITQPRCPLPSDVELGKQVIGDLAVEARDNGIPSEFGDLNGSLMIYGIVVTLYNEESWGYLSEALDETLNDGTGDLFYYAADAYLERVDGEYMSNSSEAFTAISCLDQPDAPGWTIDELREYQRESEKASPTFGWWFAGGVGCDGWPWTADEIIEDISPAEEAGPILVIGTTGDPATPFEWAESLADALSNGTLLVYEGEGHTAYGRSNQCIIDTVDAYFVDGVIPESGKVC